MDRFIDDVKRARMEPESQKAVQEVLSRAVSEPRAVLSGGAGRRLEPGTHEAQGRARVAEALQGRAAAEDVERFVAAMPARYFFTESPAQAPRHLRLLREGGLVEEERDRGWAYYRLRQGDGAPGLVRELVERGLRGLAGTARSEICNRHRHVRELAP